MIIKFHPNVPKTETKLVCNDCGCDQVETKKAGDESWDVCPDCQSVENSTEIEFVGEYSICTGIVSLNNPAGFDIVQIGNNQQIRQYDSDENWVGTAKLSKPLLANYTLGELEKLFKICTCKTCFNQIALVNERTGATSLSVTMDWEKPFGLMPRHEASSNCESGRHNHCTCDTCF